jgi:hypothetical protein
MYLRVPICTYERGWNMKNLSLNLAITATLIFFIAGCLSLSDPKTASNSAASTQTQLFAYYMAGESSGTSVGCYGDPTDTDLAGLVYTVVYTMTMEDAYTLLVCVTVPTTNAGTVPISVIANKTVNFYGSNTAVNPGANMDLTAVRLPLASTTSAVYATGSTTPCPDGSTGKLVAEFDMTDFSPLVYIHAYDECGQAVGTAMSPFEAQRKIDAGFK